jgi:ribosomal RNA-processing protein 17
MQLRDGRKADLEKHVQAIDSMVAKSHEFGSAGETTVDLEPWAGIEDVEMVDHEEEYVDEDRFTTVTVEAVNVSRDGLCKVMPDEEGSDDSNNVGLDNTSTTEGAREVQRGKPRWTKEKPHGVKKKKRKFKYETKEARKVTRRKQRLGKNTKAIARRK